MPNRKKKPRLVGPAAGSAVATSLLPQRRSRRLAGKPNGTIALANAVAENILAYLPPEEIMRSRRVCKRWKDAAKKTIVPITTYGFNVNSVRNYNLMVAMSTAMPNLTQLSLGHVDYRTIYDNGEDPDMQRASHTFHSLTPAVAFQDTMSRFRMLRFLELHNAPLNGRYPCLFEFSLLESLEIDDCKYLKWDLEMLRGMPLLKKLCVSGNGEGMTGNINSLRALKNTLEMVDISMIPICSNVVGNFMCLADFPRLENLSLFSSAVTGDIRDIGEQDFPVLNFLHLPKTVVGGDDSKFRRISEISEYVNTVDIIRRQRDGSIFNDYTWHLTDDSPDRYSMDFLDVLRHPAPPFTIEFVQAGLRVGWYWRNDESLADCCELNWLDPEPDRDSVDYERYTEDLKILEFGIYFFKGYHQPPTEREYRLLCEDRSRLRRIVEP